MPFYELSKKVMMFRIQTLTAILLVIVLTACSQGKPSLGVPIVTTNTLPGTENEQPLENPTPWIGGTQTAEGFLESSTLPPTSPPPMFTPAVDLTLAPSLVSSSPISVPDMMEMPTDFSPVLYGGKLYDSEFFLLLGAVSHDAWLTPDASVSRFAGEVTYSLHSLTQGYKYYLWGSAPNFSSAYQIYTIGTNAGLDEAGFVGVVDGWDVLKREVIELSDGAEFYQQVVLGWLADKGIASPRLGTMQTLRVDIDGDGSDEIFISSTHLDESQHITNEGDYSIVLMRKIVGNDVVTVPVIADVYSSDNAGMTFPFTYSLANFIDLNQDGVLEVIVQCQWWEGLGAAVYQVSGEDVIQVLNTGCISDF